MRADIAEDLKDNFTKLGTEEVMNYLQAKYPIFATSLVSYFVNFIVSNIIQILVKNTLLAVYFTKVDQATKEQVNDFVDALNLRTASIKGNDDEPTQKAAEENVKAAFKALIRLAD